MTIADLKQKAEKTEVFNSNNGWGFGGAIGIRYHFKNNVVLTHATACYRHLPSHKFYACSVEGKRIIDTTKLTDEQISHIYSLIN